MVKSLPAVLEARVRSLGPDDRLKEMATPLQYSCLENSTDRGAWQAAVHRIAKSQTRLSNDAGFSWIKRDFHVNHLPLLSYLLFKPFLIIYFVKL